jgi:hypothetical protein
MANKTNHSKQFRDNKGRFARTSTEEARNAGKKGGETSQQVQAEKRTLAQTIDSVIDVELSSDVIEQRIINLGYDISIAKKVTPRLMVALGFLNRCMFKSDPNAIKLLVELLGEYVETIRHELPTDKGELVLVPKKKD